VIAADLRLADVGQQVQFVGFAPSTLIRVGPSADDSQVEFTLATASGICIEHVPASTEIAMGIEHLTHRAVTEPDDGLRARLIAELHRVNSRPMTRDDEGASS
jgi:hypothetical protein